MIEFHARFILFILIVSINIDTIILPLKYFLTFHFLTKILRQLYFSHFLF